MRSETPKVLHEVAGRPILAWVLDAVRGVGCERTVIVVGHQAARVRSAFPDADLEWVEQREQRGTGHAVRLAAQLVEASRQLLIVSGDAPLITSRSLGRLAREDDDAWGTMAVARLAEPGSLGRVVKRDGRLERIVEAADASDDELGIQHVNAGFYRLPAGELLAYLERLEPDNAKGELYLTDAVGMAAAEGRLVGLCQLGDPIEARGVNDRIDLAAAHGELLRRTAERHMLAGVTVLSPERTAIADSVEIGSDTIVHPDVTLDGATRLGRGCIVHQGAWLRDSELGDGVEIKPYSVIESARIGDGAAVGPFARLRPGADLGAEVKIGNFVEIKKSRLHRGVKAGHLTYLGDAEIGEGANIGAGTVTCNYDGHAKHPTEVGSGAFIGSDTMLVAPVRVGAGAVTGAGSVITQDVPDDALGIGRSKQRNIASWSQRRRTGTKPEEDSENRS